MGHKRAFKRIRAGELAAAEITPSNLLVLSFKDGKQKMVKKKNWYRYMCHEVFLKLEEWELEVLLA